MNKETYYRRAITAICDACGYAPTHIPLLLRWWWSSWRHHPDYDEQTDDLFKVPVAGVWQHEPGLEQRALHGPTGRMEATGPVGTGTLEPHAYDKAVMSRLWQVSEEATGFAWDF